MDRIDVWDVQVAALQTALARAEVARNAAAPDTPLHYIRQEKADQINYHLLAYQSARDVLADLYASLGAATRSADRYEDNTAEDAAFYSKLALASGILAVVLLSASVRFDLAWGFTVAGVGCVIGCVLAIVQAVAARQATPDTSAIGALRNRIRAIEDACKECWTHDGLDAVDRLLYPRSGTGSTELSTL